MLESLLQNKLKLGLAALIFVGACLGAESFFIKSQKALGPELPLDLRIGMSAAEVAKTLNINFQSLDQVKRSVRGQEYFDLSAFDYAEKIGALVITERIRSQLSTKFGIVAIFNEKAVVRTVFYDDQLFDLNFEFNLSKPETRAKGDEITRNALSKYPDAKLEESKIIEGAYHLEWQREGVRAVLWVNPKDENLTLTYSSFSMFQSLIDQQRLQAEKGL